MGLDFGQEPLDGVQKMGARGLKDSLEQFPPNVALWILSVPAGLGRIARAGGGPSAPSCAGRVNTRLSTDSGAAERNNSRANSSFSLCVSATLLQASQRHTASKDTLPSECLHVSRSCVAVSECPKHLGARQCLGNPQTETQRSQSRKNHEPVPNTMHSRSIQLTCAGGTRLP